MRAVMLEVPQGFLEDRRRKGHDKRDEVWAGVLHMVPPPAFVHNAISQELNLVLLRIARPRGLRVLYETGVFHPVEGHENYRVADLVVFSPDRASKRGIEGAATLVVEILSPNDESREKLSFYAEIGVREVWLLHPITRAIEVFTLRDAVLVPITPLDGVIRSPVFDIELETASGPRLVIRDGAIVDEI